MNSAVIGHFDNAINDLGFKPKGVKVGSELYRLLNSNGRIEQKNALLGGVLDMGMMLPYLNEDIHVHVDPELDDWGYEMPINS